MALCGKGLLQSSGTYKQPKDKRATVVAPVVKGRDIDIQRDPVLETCGYLRCEAAHHMGGLFPQHLLRQISKLEHALAEGRFRWDIAESESPFEERTLPERDNICEVGLARHNRPIMESKQSEWLFTCFILCLGGVAAGSTSPSARLAISVEARRSPASASPEWLTSSFLSGIILK